MQPSDPLVIARDALRRSEWQEAHDAAAGAGTEGLEPAEAAARLDVLAEAAWWLGRLDDCIDARERAFVIYDELDDRRRAGQCAVWLYEHHTFRGRPSIAGAWLRRARQALADDTDCVEHGALLLREAETMHNRGKLDQVELIAGAVLGLARRLRSPDLEAQALQTLGRVLIDEGRVADGLAYLDEAMLFAAEDRVTPYTIGKVYCSLITACEELGDLRRATEWTEATSRWSQRHPFAVFPGLCRVHRAAALEWRGEWADAEREATRACEELAQTNMANAAAAHAEIGEIRRRLGDLGGAEEAFRRAEELCGHPQPGLALVRLAQNRIDAASAIITRALEAQPWNRLARARLLATSAHIAVAGGDLAVARTAVEELEGIAAKYESPVLLATAATSRGRLQVASGDPTACATLREALTRWQELDVPYDAATARLLLALACRAAGDHEAAAGLFSAAESSFAELGAMLDARRARELSAHRQRPGGLTEREAEVLRLVAAGYTNRDIAAALYLSEKTVARHLSNIFTKIGVSSRAAATAYAFERGIVERF